MLTALILPEEEDDERSDLSYPNELYPMKFNITIKKSEKYARKEEKVKDKR